MFKTVTTKVDFCVVGGGLAGTLAAMAAARHGIRVALMQDRPMLGGNCSSEIRMHIGGAHGKDVRETGILEELLLENQYYNPGFRFPVWDAILYEKARAEKNLTLLMNCSCLDCEMDGNRIRAVKGWQLTTETYQRVEADYFADCSGDSVLAPLTGAEYRFGREGRNEYGESIAPETADDKTMGMSVLFQYRETDSPKPYIKPDWAYEYPTDDDIPYRDHGIGSNFWWIELGGEQNCIDDTESLRDDLLKACYGVWDHVKNKGDHGMENWELEWAGMLPGKRESRRYVGEYVITQHDVERAGKHFPDIVAYGGWTMDDHFPAGMKHMTSHPTIYHPAPSPWGIPYRALISKNVENLLFAGRNISATHSAMSSSRVMATCAMMGQAVGTAVAQAVAEGGIDVRKIDVARLQRTLLDDDCWLPGQRRKVPLLTLRAKTNAEVLRNGIDRGDENLWIGKIGDPITYSFDSDVRIREIRIVFDSNLNRGHDFPWHYPLHDTRFRLPETLVTAYTIEAESESGEVTRIEVGENHRRLVRHAVDLRAKTVRLIPQKTAGSTDARLFSFEIK